MQIKYKWVILELATKIAMVGQIANLQSVDSYTVIGNSLEVANIRQSI